MIAILSDIHGNYSALSAVLRDADSLGCSEFYSLGDVAGYYCMVNECIDLLRERGIPNLMGNHDFYLTSGRPCPRSNSANLCLDYQRSQISATNLEWLKESPFRFEQDGLFMVHAGWNDPLDEYLYQLDWTYFANRKPGIYLSGHTHVQFHYEFGTHVFCNPGSVGQPRDGDWRAAYAILDGNQVSLRRVEYDVAETADRMRTAGFSDHIFKNLYGGTRIGGEISRISIVSRRRNCSLNEGVA